MNYQTNDPKGWCGDPRRGAAMGRSTIQRGPPETFTGKLYLRKIRLDSGGYDTNGTYFGHGGEQLWWCAGTSECHVIDFVLRSKKRANAKEEVLETYPNAKFFR